MATAMCLPWFIGPCHIVIGMAGMAGGEKNGLSMKCGNRAADMALKSTKEEVDKTNHVSDELKHKMMAESYDIPAFSEAVKQAAENNKYLKDAFSEPKQPEKLKWSLLPIKALKGAIRALMLGCKKDGRKENDWKKLDNIEEIAYNKVMRHIHEHREGNLINKEDGGCLHLDNALAMLMVWRDSIGDDK